MPQVLNILTLGAISLFLFFCNVLVQFNSPVSAGVLFALGGIFLNQARAERESIDKQSLFYLDSCVKAYE